MENHNFSSFLKKFATLLNLIGDMLRLSCFEQILNKRAIEESEEVRPRPDIRTGDVVEIKMVIWGVF